ncbi:MAG: NAD-dependent epimerase/dehydratase family protein, partial [Candidatus Aenigmarchaeota archaeon]|nr:NAD-dependent epimerase/dehydratase family protein [Candidatus Aenigmarchaeota archaeon]
MNILLTGASGFLGSHLLPKLVKKDYNVIILKRSFSNTWRIKNIIPQLKSYDIDKMDIEKIFRENKINVIIHLATDYGKKNSNDVSQILKSNVELPTKLLKLGTKYGSSFFVNAHTSTNSEYTLYSAMK